MQEATTSFIVIKELAGHSVPRLDPVQQFLMEHITVATNVWITVWCMTVVILFLKLWYEYKDQKHRDGN